MIEKFEERKYNLGSECQTQGNVSMSIGGGLNSNVARAWTSQDIISMEIESLQRRIRHLTALRQALPSWLGHEANELLCNIIGEWTNRG